MALLNVTDSERTRLADTVRWVERQYPQRRNQKGRRPSIPTTTPTPQGGGAVIPVRCASINVAARSMTVQRLDPTITDGAITGWITAGQAEPAYPDPHVHGQITLGPDTMNDWFLVGQFYLSWTFGTFLIVEGRRRGVDTVRSLWDSACVVRTFTFRDGVVWSVT